MKHLAIGLIFLMIFPAALGIMMPGCSRPGMNVGEKLPNLKFFDSDAKKVEIRDYARPGKLLLIHFWGAACCLTYSAPTFRSVSSIHDAEGLYGVTVVSVNLDYSPSQARRIANDLDIRHPVLNDTDSVFYRAEPSLKNVFPLALIILVDDNGVIRGKMMGPQLFPAINDLISQAKNIPGKQR